MLVVLVHTMEVALLGLIGLLVSRISKLSKQATQEEKAQNTTAKKLFNTTTLQHGAKRTDSQAYETKMKALHRAQSFSGMQLLDIKRAYGDLKAENLEWLREAISLYLIGAVDLIGKEARCDAQNRRNLINLVLRSNLKISEDSAEQYFRSALYRTHSSDNDLMVRAGAKAAKAWLANKRVPKEVGLSHQLDDWGVFA